MRLCVYNAKGGVGRTTISLALASLYSQDPQRRVLVADCDPQQSALAWAALSDETPFVVGCTRSRGFDVEIMDMAPRLPENGVLPQADLYVVPTLLDGVSFVVFLRTLALLEERRLQHPVVANRVNLKRAEHRDRLLSDPMKDACVLRERAAHGSGYAQGMTVFEMPGPHVQAARDEITRMADAIHSILRRTP